MNNQKTLKGLCDYVENLLANNSSSADYIAAGLQEFEEAVCPDQSPTATTAPTAATEPTATTAPTAATAPATAAAEQTNPGPTKQTTESTTAKGEEKTEDKKKTEDKESGFQTNILSVALIALCTLFKF